MRKGQIVHVMSKNKVLHTGEFLGVNELGAYLVGILETTVKGVSLKPGKKYISVFHAKESQLVLA